MKTFAFFILASLFSSYSFSQDTLYTTDGSVLAGRVTEINQDAIKYKKSSNPDGPVYVLNKSDIVLIEYQNGSKEVFKKTAGSMDASTANSNTNNNNNNNNDGVYANPGPAVNVIVGGSPYAGYNSWGWGGWGGGFGWGGWGGWGFNRGWGGWGGGWGRSYGYNRVYAHRGFGGYGRGYHYGGGYHSGGGGGGFGGGHYGGGGHFGGGHGGGGGHHR